MFNHDIPNYGHVEIRSILSNRVLVQFSVPDHEWNKLEQSKEWQDFQFLLEECQKAHSHT